MEWSGLDYEIIDELRDKQKKVDLKKQDLIKKIENLIHNNKLLSNREIKLLGRIQRELSK